MSRVPCRFSGRPLLMTGLLASLLALPAIAWTLEQEPAEPLATSVPIEELRTLSEVLSRIRAEYVEDISDQELLESAIRGMLRGLDPHSSYLSPEELEDVRVGTRGRFGGLGLEVGEVDGFIRVIAPIDDTPAQRAGIRAGDLIIRIDGESTQGMSLNEAVRRMRGAPGQEIQLTILREADDSPLDITLVRDLIRILSVRGRMLEPGYGYVRISQFQSQTGMSLIEVVEGLQAEYDDRLKGLVLDLRNNPGGVLQAAVSVADAFLSSGLIVETRGRVEHAQMRFEANPQDVLAGVPMVVLINGGSASASEIVAGALQDQRRAVIMGGRSFGKGSVQSIVPLESGAAIRLTTARYYTPSGRSIQAEGIEPDVFVDDLELSTTADRGLDPVRERDLSRHLRQERDSAVSETGPMLAVQDFPLFEALNLLKALSILER
jgi:carboxyl-terminal processing protease